MADVLLVFGVGDECVCYDILIVNDTISELEPMDDFFSNNGVC